MRQFYLFVARVRAVMVVALIVVLVCLGSRVHAATSELEIEHPTRGSVISGTTYIELNTGSDILEARVYLS